MVPRTISLWYRFTCHEKKQALWVGRMRKQGILRAGRKLCACRLEEEDHVCPPGNYIASKNTTLVVFSNPCLFLLLSSVTEAMFRLVLRDLS
jgi:hypothetical protein